MEYALEQDNSVGWQGADVDSPDHDANGADGDAGALQTLSTCVACRKRRRACSKTLPRCDRCDKAGVDCVFRLAGLLRSAFVDNPRDPSLPVPQSEQFDTSEMLLNGVIGPFIQGVGTHLPETKRACTNCHGGKRSCEGGIPCSRCKKQGLECEEWIPERAKKRLEGAKGKKRRGSAETVKSEMDGLIPLNGEGPSAKRPRGRPRKYSSHTSLDSASIVSGSEVPSPVDLVPMIQLPSSHPIFYSSPNHFPIPTRNQLASSSSLFLSPGMYSPSLLLGTNADYFGLPAGAGSGWIPSVPVNGDGEETKEIEELHPVPVKGTNGKPAMSLKELIDLTLPGGSNLKSSSFGSMSTSTTNTSTSLARLPGSWDPPLSPPPRTVDRFLSPFPVSTHLPSSTLTNSLVTTFLRTVFDVFPYLHRSTFAGQLRNDRTLLSALCLGAFHASEDPEINATNSIDLQHRLFNQSMIGVKAVLDKYLGRGKELPSSIDLHDPNSDSSMDPICETLFSLCMLAFWASNCGQVNLFSQLVDVSFRLMIKVGLHRDLASSGRGKREAWIRRAQRRVLWFCLSYHVFFANHWSHLDGMPRILQESDRMLIPMYPGILFARRSQDPEFDPEPFEPWNLPHPTTLERPAMYGDLVSWMKLPHGHPRRIELLKTVGDVIWAEDRRYDTRFSYVMEYVHWNLRMKLNSFLKDCKDMGVSPADLEGARKGDQMLDELRKTRDHLELLISDILTVCPPKSVREAEESGDFSALMQSFSDPEDGDIAMDKYRSAAHVQVQYWIAVRLMRLELRTSYGTLTFAEIAQGGMDAEFTDGEGFRECLKDSVVYTRHLRSLMKTSFPLQFDIYHTGLTVPKLGALHLALLSACLRSRLRNANAVDRSVILGLHSDLDVCVEFVRCMAPEKRPKGSKAWQQQVRKVFAKLLVGLKHSEGYRAFYGTCSGFSGDQGGEGHVESGVLPIEVEIAHLRRDVETGVEMQGEKKRAFLAVDLGGIWLRG